MISVSDIFVDDSNLRDAITSHIYTARQHRRIMLRGKHVPDSSAFETWPIEVSSGYIVGLRSIVDRAVAGFSKELETRLRRGERESNFGRVPAWSVSSDSLQVELDFWSLMRDTNTWFRLDEQTLSWLNKFGRFEAVNQYRIMWRTAYFESFKTTNNLMLESWRYAVNGLLNSRISSVEVHKLDSSQLKFLSKDESVDSDDKFIYGNQAANLINMILSIESLRPNLEQLREARNALLLAKRRDESDANKQISRGNFQQFWSSMKNTVSANVDKNEVQNSFSSIPILPSGTASSRTWGIEIEVVAAGRTSRPRGWDERSDGSLEPAEYADDECQCGCDECCDYESHCGYDDCTDSNSCAEYVSPILNWFNSDGVRRICDELVDAPCNDSPGIHIHVGASDLTAPDIARLAVAYSAVSPYIWPLMHRNRVNYCRDITSDTIAYWLSIAKDIALGKFEIQPRHYSAIQYIQAEQPDDRYHDLNLKALGAHGTVEFRALGPIYDYEHIIRWAWFCREMVNISKLPLPQSTWTNVRSMADVIKILQTYGQEQLPEGALKLYLKGDKLELEQLEEAKG